MEYCKKCKKPIGFGIEEGIISDMKKMPKIQPTSHIIETKIDDGLCDSCAIQNTVKGINGFKLDVKNMDEIKHYPEPAYCKCNAGHTLTEVYDERLNAYIWDCPICIKKMQK